MTTNFTVNGRAASTDAPPVTPLLWVIREELKLTGTKFGCGTGLCGACMVHIDGKACVLVPDPGLGDGRQVRDHDRRPVGGFIAPSTESVARRAGAAMRLLPVRANHERSRSAQAEPKAHARADRRTYEHEYLPLRNLSAHRARGRARHAGGLSHDNECHHDVQQYLSLPPPGDDRRGGTVICLCARRPARPCCNLGH